MSGCSRRGSGEGSAGSLGPLRALALPRGGPTSDLNPVSQSLHQGLRSELNAAPGACRAPAESAEGGGPFPWARWPPVAAEAGWASEEHCEEQLLASEPPWGAEVAVGHCVARETQTEAARAEVTGKPHASLWRPRCRPYGSPGSRPPTHGHTHVAARPPTHGHTHVAARPPTHGHTHVAAMRGRKTMLEVASTLTVERREVGGVRATLASVSFCSSRLREAKSRAAASGAGLSVAQVFSCPTHSGFSPSLGAEGLNLAPQT
ncbi:unnamed protein product [Rangifer tarandus platyrhynchus]|uniref:Uncharacterized protein n=1 Tax=Rangifer tarandus platyrhynchus TaxID=3082113 RepID=A0ACB1MKV3_RANTA